MIPRPGASSWAWARRLGLLVAVLALALVAVLGGASSPAGRSPADTTAATAPALALAADASQFRPGNIISDNMFFDGAAMAEPEIQAFLTAKGANCRAAAMPCIKDIRLDTPTIAADAYCSGYAGARQESAASVIAKVGRACGISQRAILVIMEKEQGLIRKTSPTVRGYDAALGFACPDTAPCDPAYAGFAKQIYYGVRVFKVYAATAGTRNYRAGRNNYVQYNPDAGCGGSQVYIENQATAGLYVYTPYQPNAAALAAGYGSAPCGAYGNRNFWLYYTDWFGSTQSPGGNAVVTRALAPGASTVLGTASGSVVCGLADGGCYQAFAKGSVYWSPGTGAQIVKGLVRDRWAALGWETGSLGYPTGEEVCGLVGSGCYQNFQKGMAYWSPASGAWSVRGLIKDAWAASGWEGGALGYPLSDESCGLVGDGCWSRFQKGSIYYAPATGTQTVLDGPVSDRWAAQGRENGALGYPVSGTMCGLAGGGCWQVFQGGSVYWTPATGARVVQGDVRDHWGALGWETGTLGYPVGEQVCGLAGGGCYQDFQNATVYDSPGSGAWSVRGVIKEKWGTWGWEAGSLGYPVSDQVCGLSGGGCFSEFQRGAVYWSPATGVHVVASGPGRDAWAAQGWERGALGYPVGDTVCGLTGGGCFTSFQQGTVYSSTATGGQVVANGPLRDVWAAQGFETGALGYPTGNAVCGLPDRACTQRFQGGTVTTSATTGTHAVTGAVHVAWTRWGGVSGDLGHPTDDQRCGLAAGGCTQTFQGGSVYDSADTDARMVRGAIRDVWVSRGAQDGALGYPTSDEVCGLVGGGCFTWFQGGAVYFSPGTGVRVLTGPVLDKWSTQRYETGLLGYPVADQVCGLTGAGCAQQFQGGSVYWTASTGARQVIGAVRDAWVAQGAERGALGYPLADEVCGLARNGCYQAFQGGWVYFSPAGGGHALTGQLQAAWAALGWENGALGYPTGDAVCGLTGGGCSQRFERGSLYWTAGTGAHLVRGAVRDSWTAQAAEQGPLGYPVTDEVCGLARNGCYQAFQNGWTYFSPATGAHPLSGPVQAAWAAQGWETGKLGYPTGDPVTTGATVTQRFEGGTLVLDRQSGRVTRG
ncbi:hypothetical protein KUM42_06575 [Modestobacter sp. L9-4]|uniref:hypothetical protein n=1 Tax=Modestobacter sp. L9-4 TaxID=2851567 RepID=UPI001C75430B|nr:hypothetical protein [Modestobacter sp. L9-4]QXG77177.1 hypothetical protein KUM42_06575 [Modestobacter sp. L9-4]